MTVLYEGPLYLGELVCTATIEQSDVYGTDDVAELVDMTIRIEALELWFAEHLYQELVGKD